MKYLCFLFLCLIIAACSETNMDNENPNIVFLLSDDQRDNTFGAMGHPFVKTPHTDLLINGGVRFSNAYIAEPTCSPSRISFFTGMYERVNGVGFSSSYQLSEKQWEISYPELLRANGYYTGFIGKFGVEYYSFKNRASEKFDYWRGHDGWAKFWVKTAGNCQAYYDLDEDIITPAMGESITDFLNSTPDNKPFCLSVSFSVPHGSQINSMFPDSKGLNKCLVKANENPDLKGNPFYDQLYREQNIEIPKETATNPYAYIPELIMDQNQGRANQTYIYDYDRESCLEHHIRYYQQISGMDKVIGDMVETLKEKGLFNNTIIIFASDHGLLMGEYGMGGKALLYDLTMKIPCFIYDPRLPEGTKGLTIDKLVSSLDITSTILEYAGITPSVDMQGRSLIPLINGDESDWREELFLENLYTGRDNPFCEGIRIGNFKYIRMFDGVNNYIEGNVDFSKMKPDFEQLFDLGSDPEEMINLIHEFEGTEILEQFREKTKAHSNQLNNTRTSYVNRHEVETRLKE